ncbi:MAG: FtsK/SpoIIIE domain-containing protein, partial [Steroidobacteraceae bacterium]
ETFSVEHTRQLLKQLGSDGSLAAIRECLGPERPWQTTTWREPAARALWMEAREVRKTPAEEPAAPHPIAEQAQPSQATSSAVVPDAGATKPSAEQPDPLAVKAVPTTLEELLASKVSAATIDDGAAAWLEATAKALQKALVGWSFQAKVLGTRLTPNAGLIRLLGSDRLETKDVENNRQRLLTTHSLNVLSVTPRPGEIIVAIERPNRQIVSLWDVWHRAPKRRSESLNLSLLVGVRELDGETLYLNLGDGFGGQPSHAPHTLIAGTTGSGKSILILNLIVDLALTNSASAAKIYCIDPKMGVDYVALEGLPHLAEDIVVDQGRAIEVLEELVGEMDARYRRFAEAKVPNLRAFNARAIAS